MSKIFVSYKFKDYDVKKLYGVSGPTWPVDYVNYLKDYVLTKENNDIYKGEESDEDLSAYSEVYIKKHLKDKIYDSTITIVLISPNMKEKNRSQKYQWIPWEISYSLLETTRNNRTSHNNAMLAVVLPDSLGSYRYCNINNLFPILKENIENGYIHVVNWDYFISNPRTCLAKAMSNRELTPKYKIKVRL